MSDRSWGVPGGLFLFLSPSIVGYEVVTLSIGIRGCTVLILEREKKYKSAHLQEVQELVKRSGPVGVVLPQSLRVWGSQGKLKGCRVPELLRIEWA